MHIEVVKGGRHDSPHLRKSSLDHDSLVVFTSVTHMSPSRTASVTHMSPLMSHTEEVLVKHERDAYEDTQPQVHSQVCSLFSLHHVEPPRNLHHVAEDVRKLRLWLLTDAVVAREQRPAKSMRTHRSESRRAGEEVPFARGHSHRDIRSGLNIRRLNSQSIQEGQELMQHSFLLGTQHSFFTC